MQHIWIYRLSTGTLLLLFTLLQPASAQVAEPADSTTGSKDLRFSALPIVFRTPETRWAAGAGALFNYTFGSDTTTRASQAIIGGAYTQERQLLSYLTFQVFTPENKWWWQGELGYYRYFYYFWGIGHDTRESAREKFEVNFPRLKLTALKQIAEKRSWFVGLGGSLDDYSIDTQRPGRLLRTGEIVGSNGGRVIGMGPSAVHDTRDQIYFPKSGSVVQANAFFYSRFLLSDFDFIKTTIDASTFWTPFSGRDHILGANVFFQNILGDAPFNELSLLGDTKRMRGYYQGRYRDNNQLALQLEYRSPVLWRFGAALFVAYGAVAEAPQQLFNREYHTVGGGGLRFLLNQKEHVNLRLDYAFGKNTSGFYLTFGEAF